MNHSGQVNVATAQYGRDAGPVPNLPIPNALSAMSQSINDLSHLADALVARLGGVLSPSYPKNETKPQEHATLAAALPPTSQCADDIVGYTRRVQNIGAQLQDALTRLEI